MHFNAQLETWWLGDFVGDSTPLLKQAVKAVEVCPADNDQVLTAWSSQHQLVNDDSQTTTTRYGHWHNFFELGKSWLRKLLLQVYKWFPDQTYWPLPRWVADTPLYIHCW